MFVKIDVIELTANENEIYPIIVIVIHMAFSGIVCGVMSPYPTVAMVVTIK
jgi:hypothetical protein